MAVTGLERDRGAVQLALPIDGPGGRALDDVLDDVRERFGPAAVTRATLLGRDRLAPRLGPE